jgi:transcriptional regulator with XRE-family HTH domain
MTTASHTAKNGTPSELDSAAERLERALGSVLATRTQECRQEAGLTVADLAARAGLSKGMVSKIETGQASPSLSSLAKIAAALAVPVTTFFRGLEEEQDAFYVKAGDGLEITVRGSRAGHSYRLLGAGRRSPYNVLEPVLVRIVEPSEVFPLYQIDGVEFIFAVTGVLDYIYGASTFRLEPGDSLQFDARVPHGPTRIIEAPVEYLSIKAYGRPDRRTVPG